MSKSAAIEKQGADLTITNAHSEIVANKSSTTLSIASVARFIFVACLIQDTISGPLRAALYTFNIEYFFYITKILCIVTPAFLMLHKGAAKFNSSILILILFAITFRSYMVYQNIPQVMFGFYMFGPFIFGFFFGNQILFKGLEKYVFALWVIAVAGVTFTAFIDFPWASVEIEVAGVERAAVRTWETGGLTRAYGFAGSSGGAADVLLVLSAILLVYFKTKIRGTVILITFIALLLTTMKGAMIAFLAIVFLIYFKSDRIYRATITTLVTVNILLPLATYYYGNSIIPVLDQVLGGFTLGFLSFDTLFQRAQMMWPAALDYVSSRGGIILGTGIGGMGPPLAMNTSENTIIYGDLRFVAADSFFVYFVALFGISIIPIMIYFLRLFKNIRFGDRNVDFAKIFFASMLAMGITQPIIQGPIPFMMLGASICIALTSARTADRGTR